MQWQNDTEPLCFALPPCCAGMMFVLLYGRKGLFAPLIASGVLPPIVFAFPGALGAVLLTSQAAAACAPPLLLGRRACCLTPIRKSHVGRHTSLVSAPSKLFTQSNLQAWRWPRCL